MSKRTNELLAYVRKRKELLDKVERRKVMKPVQNQGKAYRSPKGGK